MANIPRVLLLRTNESASPRMSVNGTKQTYGSGAMQSAQERKADCPRFCCRRVNRAPLRSDAPSLQFVPTRPLRNRPGPRQAPHRHPPKSGARTTTVLVRRVYEEGPCRINDTAPACVPLWWRRPDRSRRSWSCPPAN